MRFESMFWIRLNMWHNGFKAAFVEGGTLGLRVGFTIGCTSGCMIDC